MNSAKIIVRECLAIKPGEKVLILTDKNKRHIANTLLEAAPHSKLKEIPVGKINGEEPPADIAMQDFDVIIIPTTKSLTHTNAVKEAVKKGARVATLPGITKDIIDRAVPVDYESMARETNKLAQALIGGKEVKITTKLGANLTFSIQGRSPKADTGLLRRPGTFGNLPAGEAFIAPVEGTAEGKLIVDASFAGIGKLSFPIKIIVKKGYAISVGSSSLQELLESVKDKNAFNIAEFGIGTNPKAQISGSILEDEKVKGTAHIALGKNNSFGGAIGVPIHLDGVFTSPSIFIDGKKIMEAGSILI